MQTYMQHVKRLTLDEMSMVACKLFSNMNDKCQAACQNFTLPMGGLGFLMAGDFGQLPPVQGNSLLGATLHATENSTDLDDKAGILVRNCRRFFFTKNERITKGSVFWTRLIDVIGHPELYPRPLALPEFANLFSTECHHCNNTVPDLTKCKHFHVLSKADVRARSLEWLTAPALNSSNAFNLFMNPQRALPVDFAIGTHQPLYRWKVEGYEPQDQSTLILIPDALYPTNYAYLYEYFAVDMPVQLTFSMKITDGLVKNQKGLLKGLHLTKDVQQLVNADLASYAATGHPQIIDIPITPISFDFELPAKTVLTINPRTLCVESVNHASQVFNILINPVEKSEKIKRKRKDVPFGNKTNMAKKGSKPITLELISPGYAPFFASTLHNVEGDSIEGCLLVDFNQNYSMKWTLPAFYVAITRVRNMIHNLRVFPWLSTNIAHLQTLSHSPDFIKFRSAYDSEGHFKTPTKVVSLNFDPLPSPPTNFDPPPEPSRKRKTLSSIRSALPQPPTLLYSSNDEDSSKSDEDDIVSKRPPVTLTPTISTVLKTTLKAALLNLQFDSLNVPAMVDQWFRTTFQCYTNSTVHVPYIYKNLTALEQNHFLPGRYGRLLTSTHGFDCLIHTFLNALSSFFRELPESFKNKIASFFRRQVLPYFLHARIQEADYGK